MRNKKQARNKGKGNHQGGQGGYQKVSKSKMKKEEANQKSKRQIKKTQDELQWIVAQRLLSALTIPGFS